MDELSVMKERAVIDEAAEEREVSRPEVQSIPPGYKQTEVGVIPEDWDIKPLPDVVWFQEGPGLRNWQFTKSGMKVINVTNLENGVLEAVLKIRDVRELKAQQLRAAQFTWGPGAAEKVL